LFDIAVLVRGLAQGTGLLMLLCGVYVWSSHQTRSDDVARAMTFTVLVLSNIGLIYVNRTWNGSTWHKERAGNRYFNWMAMLTVALLTTVLAIPEIARLFSFVPPPMPMQPAAAGGALLATLWFEAVKSVLRHRQNRTSLAT
jgi:Ca2+-transporting ATPase